MTQHATCSKCGAIVPPDGEICEPCGMRMTIVRQTTEIVRLRELLADMTAQVGALDIELQQLRSGR